MGFTVSLVRGGFPPYNLTTGYEGVKLLGGVSGFLDPEFTAYWTERIGDGDRWRGSRLTRRQMQLPIRVGKGSATLDQDFRELDAAFWRTISRTDVCLLDVALEDLSHRYIPVRLDRATSSAIDFDPGLTGHKLYLMTLVADDPYWRGDDVVETWSFTGGSTNFYAGPYTLSPSGGFGAGIVTNPGDVPAWPKFRITGPCSSALITVDGHTIALPNPIPAFSSIYIHTDPPDVFGDFLESRWHEMTGARDFAPVPVGAAVEVTVNLTSPAAGAAATMTITPRYERAW
jgi:hypothetical protein